MSNIKIHTQEDLHLPRSIGHVNVSSMLLLSVEPNEYI